MSNRFLLFFLLFAFSAQSMAKETIHWIHSEHQPPAYYAKGERKGSGFGDVALQFFIKNMPEYNHVHEPVPMNRSYASFEANKNISVNPSICIPVAMAEAHKIKVSEKAQVYMPPMGLVIRKSDVAKFNGGKKLALTALLQDSSLRGMMRWEVLPAELSPFLNETRHVQIQNASPNVQLEMLLSNRFDYLVNWPVVAKAGAEELGVEEKILTIPLIEITKPTECRFAYSLNTPPKVVDALKRIAATEEFQAAVMKSYVDKLPDVYKEEYGRIRK